MLWHNQLRREFRIPERELLNLLLLDILWLIVLQLQRVLHERRGRQFEYQDVLNKHIQINILWVLAYANRRFEFHSHLLLRIHLVRSHEQIMRRQYLTLRSLMPQPNRVLIFQVPVVEHHVDHELHTKCAHP